MQRSYANLPLRNWQCTPWCVAPNCSTNKLGLAMLSTLVTICELGRAAGWTEIAKIPVDAIIKRWKVKGCEKGQSRRLKKLFVDGHVVDAEMEQAAWVPTTVSN